MIGEDDIDDMEKDDVRPSTPTLLDLVRSQLETARKSELRDDSLLDQDGGLTLDLSNRKIQNIPLEVLQLIQDEVERLALSHNQLSKFAEAFSSCSRLRYLNIRSNMFREFPTVLCSMSSLEILDISKNRIKSLPSHFGSLMKLKVLSVSKNKIQILPNYIGNMEELKILKVDHNPILFPPRSIVEFNEDGEADKDSWLEALKQFLKLHAERSGVSNSMEESGSSTDPGSDVEFSLEEPLTEFDLSHDVALDDTLQPLSDSESPQDKYENRITEISRSNSETTLNRFNRRPGYGPKKEDGTPPAEVRIIRQHTRGISYDSSIGNKKRLANSMGFDDDAQGELRPPNEVNSQPEPYFRRLSALGTNGDPQTLPAQLAECSRGILYAVSQVQPTIYSFVAMSNDVGMSCIGLEKVLPAVNMSIGELVKALELYDTKDDLKSVEILHNATRACVITFRYVLGQLQTALHEIGCVEEKRYNRTLLLLVFGSFAEIMNTWTSFGLSLAAVTKGTQDSFGNYYDEQNMTPPTPSGHSTLDNQLTSADEALFEKLLQTLNSTMHFITLLMDAIKRTLTSNAEGRLTLQTSTLTKLKELNGVSIGGMEVTRRLKTRMDTIREADISDRRRFAEDITRFVTSVMSIGELAKAGSMEFPFHKSVFANFSPVARSTKEVTVLLHVSSFRGLNDSNYQNFNQGPMFSPMPFPSPMAFQPLSPQIPSSALTTPLSAALGPAAQAIVQIGSHKYSISSVSSSSDTQGQARTLTELNESMLAGLSVGNGTTINDTTPSAGTPSEAMSPRKP